MKQVTGFTKKVRAGFMGAWRIQEGDFTTVEFSGITRMNRDDAMFDVKMFLGDLSLYDMPVKFSQ